jgi:succinate dehydrogenase / fumarate reductase, membrane anchor subunit
MATVRTRPQVPTPRRGLGRSGRGWGLTTLSGLAVLILVTVHMVANHFVIESVGGLRDYHQVLEYISNPVIFVLESLFLVFVTIHAMLGLRGVLLDLDPTPRTLRWIDRGLVALGIATLAYGFLLIGVLASRA